MRPHSLDPRPDVRLEPLSPRVTVAYGPLTGERWRANATIVVGDRDTAVVDAMMTPAQTAPVRAEAERIAAYRPAVETYRDLPMAGERLPLAVRGLAVALGFAAAAP